MVLAILTAASPALVLVDALNYSSGRLVRAMAVGVLVPALLALVVATGKAAPFGISAGDSRFAVVAIVSGLFVGIRAVGGLAVVDEFDGAATVLSLLVSLSGFALMAVLWPRGRGTKLIFSRRPHPVHVVLVVVAALQFIVLRESESVFWSFVYSAGSIVGPSVMEYVFLATLVAIGFLADPWRQFAAIPVAVFSFTSFAGNVLLADAPLRPWPNPVVFACCVALMFPLNESLRRGHVEFPR